MTAPTTESAPAGLSVLSADPDATQPLAGPALTAFASATAEDTSFHFTSTPGSWVGHGYLNYAISPADGWTFSATMSPDQTYVGLHASRPADPTLSNYYWDLDLKAPGGQPLMPGSYPNATRYPFNASTEPGMWLSGNHRGDNVITGFFNVLQAEFVGGTVTRFAVDFRQYDEGNPNNWVDGQFRFNATVPEPAGAAVGVIAAAMLGFRRIRRQRD